MRKARTTQTEEDKEAYQASRIDYRKQIVKAKKESWQNFCQSITALPKAARLQKIVSHDKECQVGLLKLQDGTYAKDENQSLKHLMRVHFPQCTFTEPNNQVNEPQDRTTQEPADWETANKVVSKEKLEWAIQRFIPFKSTGPDEVFPALLQHGMAQLIPPLVNIFKGCIALGYLPSGWRKARVVFIPKPGKSTYAEAKSFRPISLTSFVLKTLERLVDRYIRDSTLMEHPLNSGQHAYMAGKSTETALHELVRMIEKGLDRKEYTLGVFLDIEGAFSNAPHGTIIRALQQKGVECCITKWAMQLLTGQNVVTTLGKIKLNAMVTKGVPQGGVLAPLMWNLVVDSLLEETSGDGIYIQGYADDIVILVAGICVQTITSRMQMALKQVEDWCNRNGLSVNPGKTEMVLFTRKIGKINFKAPWLYGKQLTLVREVKFLGVILDCKLIWEAHLKKAYNKGITSLWQCRRIVGKKWGITPRIIVTLYPLL